MPHYHWIRNPKDKDGHSTGGTMKQVPASLASPVEDVTVVQPPNVNVTQQGKVKKFACKLCEKKFGTAGVMSIHFKRDHTELWRDKDTFRQYMEVEG